MAINPYGLHGGPAVGGGAPGLPRRTTPVPPTPPGQDPFNWDDYNILQVSGAGLLQLNTLGEVVQQEDFSITASATLGALSEDHKYLLVNGAHTSGTGLMDVHLYQLMPFKRLSTVKKANVANANGAAINTKLGLLAIASEQRTALIYRISDFISADGGNLADLTLVDSVEGTGTATGSQAVHLGRIDWSPEGDLILLSTSRGGLSGARTCMRSYPGKNIVFDYVSGVNITAGWGSSFQGFSQSGEFVVYPAASGNSNLGQIVRNESGVFVKVEDLAITPFIGQYATIANDDSFVYTSGALGGDFVPVIRRYTHAGVLDGELMLFGTSRHQGIIHMSNDAKVSLHVVLGSALSQRVALTKHPQGVMFGGSDSSYGLSALAIRGSLSAQRFILKVR